MINKVILIGNLGRDPETRHLEGGSVVSKFSVATNENYQDKSGKWQTVTEWHNVVCWGPLAERSEKSLKKGNLIFLEGKLTTRKWQDKDGVEKYTTEIVAKTIRPLERRESVQGGHVEAGFGDNQGDFPTIDRSSSDGGSPVSLEDDDLPF